ncbi:MAG: nitroreductase family protein [Spirochaetales bacterium]|nr:nitroreductase family protein [Spirochaetales bacterium]
MEILPEILGRKSIRKFKSTPIKKEILNRIVDAGVRAPSAKNRQEWRFIVIQKEDLRKKIQDAAFGQEYVGQAPAIIAACTTNIDYRMPNGQLSYPVDLSIAMSFMMLQAVHEGMGTCCITTFDEQEIKELFTVPFSMRVVMLLLIGAPDEDPEQSARKPVKRVVSFDHW